MQRSNQKSSPTWRLNTIGRLERERTNFQKASLSFLRSHQSCVVVDCTSAFTVDTRAECALQETLIPALGATGCGGAVTELKRARRPGASKVYEEARREEHLDKQETEACQDICRCCSALGLAEIVQTEALANFRKVANSIHARLKVVCAPRTIVAIFSVADRGTTEMDVVSFELQAQGHVEVIKKKLTASPPAAVALVYTLSLTDVNHCDQHMFSRVSEASFPRRRRRRRWMSPTRRHSVPSQDQHHGCRSRGI